MFINDDKPGIHWDAEDWLEKLAFHVPVSQLRIDHSHRSDQQHLAGWGPYLSLVLRLRVSH